MRLLRDPTGKGFHRANYTTSPGGKGSGVKLKPESEWILQAVEPIVPETLWNECNRILNEQRALRKPLAKRPTNLFAGLLFCHCGSKMYVPSRSQKYTCVNKSCRNKVPVQDLEAVFQEQLKAFTFAPTELDRIAQKAQESVVDKEKLYQTLSS